MSLSKDITITVKDYTATLSSPLKLYKNDSLELNFTIEEFGIKIINGTKRRVAMPITPLQATLIIENPSLVDVVEPLSITGDIIKFNLTSKHTQFIGISKMQIILKDTDGCRVTLPDFQLEIKEGIGEEGNTVVIQDKYITDNEGNALTTKDDFSIEYTGTGTNKKKITELTETNIIKNTDYLILEQVDGTKKINVSNTNEIHVGPNTPTGNQTLWIDTDDVLPTDTINVLQEKVTVLETKVTDVENKLSKSVFIG